MHLPSETAALAMLLSILATLRLWLKAQRLEKKLNRVTKGLLQLVDESESATNELRRSLLGLAERRQVGPEKAADFEVAAPGAVAEMNASDPWDIDRRHRVLTLARRGLQVRDIARRLCLPDGEVELMLRLSKQEA